MRTCHTLFLALVAFAAACASPLVGAECKPGRRACDGVCVNVSVDYQNCGACGHDCGDFLCVDGVCTDLLRPDAGAADGGGVDGGTVDGGSDAGTLDAGPAGPADGGLDPDPNLGGCSVGQQACGGVCSDPLIDPINCGVCGTVCAGNEVCSLGACDAVCDPSLSQCNGLCLDFDADPSNCGACGASCASGICEAGACADALPGYVVVIGHDLTNANSAMRRLAGDAAFLGRGNPVRVLAYRGDATAASITGVEAALDTVSMLTGRAWARTDAIDSIVPLQLREADTFLIHAQGRARKATLAKLATQWGDALAQFANRGGVIVLFEAPSTTNDGTFRLLGPSKIFSASSRTSVPSQQLKVVGVGLGVAMNLPDRYVGLPNTSSFRGVTTPGTTLVQDNAALPVVIQRVVVPPH